MRFTWTILLILCTISVFGQSNEAYVVSIEVSDTIFYKTDRSPLISTFVGAEGDDIIDLSGLESPIINRIVIKPFDKQYFGFQGFKGNANFVLEENGKDKYFLSKNRTGLNITAEISGTEGIDIRPSMVTGNNFLRYNKLGRGWNTRVRKNKGEFSQSNRVLGKRTLLLPNGRFQVLAIESILGADKSISFFSKDHKLPLAKISYRESTITSVDFQIFREMETQQYNDYIFARKDILAHPNPTFGPTRFEFINYPAGEYKVRLYNIVGKGIWDKSYTLSENGVIRADFSFLNKGTYLYSILDADNNKLTTKRLVIITP